MSRNLMEELHERRELASKREAPPARPARKKRRTDENNVIDDKLLAASTAKYDRSAAMIAVEVTEELVQAFLDFPLFFDTGVTVNGRKVWRSMASEGAHLLWWFQQNGWYCANTLWTDEKDKNSVDNVLIQAWAQPAEDSANMPGVVHLAHFPNYGITVYAAKEACSLMLAEVEDLRSEIWKKPASQAENDDAGAKSDVPRQHGGWLPKMAQMIAALWNEDYKYVDKRANRFYFGSQPLQKLVDNKLK